jgi:2-polyprenyl-3-methyl-5-hydroxy-6-metoxy-1,4-benzoquinol methylase
MSLIYATAHPKFIDRVVIKKRKEMVDIINNHLENYSLSSVLDIGTTNDLENESSNYLVKNIKNIKIFKSLSNQKIDSKFFQKTLNKSITEELNDHDISTFSSDVVISNATIEHVGNVKNQLKKISNTIKLSKKIFIITTPNRYHPIDFHTKIPLIHWFPKKIHRKILSLLGLNFFAKEENLNLLSKNNLEFLLSHFKNIEYKIHHIKLMNFKSNFIIIGKII